MSSTTESWHAAHVIRVLTEISARHLTDPTCSHVLVTSGQTMTGRSWLALLVVYLVWGSTYLGMAIVVHSAPALMTAATRFLAAGLIVAAVVCVISGPRRLRVTRPELAGAALTGIMLLGIGNGGVSLAERYVPSGVAALLIATVPLWIILFRFIGRDRPSARTVVGVVVGLAGVTLLVIAIGNGHVDAGTGYTKVTGGVMTAWMIVIVACSFVWALGSFNAPRLAATGRAPADPIASAVYQFLAAGLALFVVGIATGENPAGMLDMGSDGNIAWVYLVFGGIAAYTCYVWLLSHAPVSIVSTYAFVNPAVAVVLGFFLLSEPFGPGNVVAGVLVLIGVALVVRGERRHN